MQCAVHVKRDNAWSVHCENKVLNFVRFFAAGLQSIVESFHLISVEVKFGIEFFERQSWSSLTSIQPETDNRLLHVPSAPMQYICPWHQCNTYMCPRHQCNTCALSTITTKLHVPSAPMRYMCPQHQCNTCTLSTNAIFHLHLILPRPSCTYLPWIWNWTTSALQQLSPAPEIRREWIETFSPFWISAQADTWVYNAVLWWKT